MTENHFDLLNSATSKIRLYFSWFFFQDACQNNVNIFFLPNLFLKSYARQFWVLILINFRCWNAG